MKIGNLDIDDFKVGTQQVDRIYLGSQLAWEPVAPPTGITLRGTSEATDTSTGTGSLVLPVPAGLQVGDYATITLAVHGSGTTNVTWPGDFTQFVSNTVGANALLSAEGTITTVPASWTISTRNQRMAAQCIAYSGGLAVDAIKDDTIDEASSGSGNPVQFPSYDTDSDGSWLVQYISISGTGGSITDFGAIPPPSMTATPVADASIPAGWGIILQGAYEEIPNAGPTGTRDWTNPRNNGWSANTWVMRAAV